jgi:hypothetical protein
MSRDDQMGEWRTMLADEVRGIRPGACKALKAQEQNANNRQRSLLECLPQSYCHV